VYFATTGEMSGTILAHPEGHAILIDLLKEDAAQGNPVWKENIKVSYIFRYESLCKD
jgi:hypothetical protein